MGMTLGGGAREAGAVENANKPGRSRAAPLPSSQTTAGGADSGSERRRGGGDKSTAAVEMREKGEGGGENVPLVGHTRWRW